MKYTALDIFAGAGGISLGLEKAGIEVVAAVEKDKWACETYVYNHNNKTVFEADIQQLDDEFFSQFKNVDILVGGPPCQGFSIAASNRRKEFDARNFLYKEYLRIAKVTQPKILLIENVKELAKFVLPDGSLLIEDILKNLEELGYKYTYDVINTRYYGIPQERKRFFLIGVKESLNIELDNINNLLKPYLKNEVSVNEAIGDLPNVKPRELKEDDLLDYINKPQNEYQKEMRLNSQKIYNHIPMKHTAKTVEKFSFILENRKYDELPERLKARERSNPMNVSKSKFEQNHRILNGEKVSPTITASFYSSFIHPNQPRNITVREAARLQSFPDDFVFKGKRTTLSKKLLEKKGIKDELYLDQFNQVGNAVPPKLCEYFGLIFKDLLKERKK